MPRHPTSCCSGGNGFMHMGLSLPLSINVKPFTRAESHFADARFFEVDITPKQTIRATITSTGRGSMKNIIQMPREDVPAHQL